MTSILQDLGALSIPRIIHQTYKTRNLPSQWKKTPSSWTEIHPLWTYMFWDDLEGRELVKRTFPDFLPIFDAYEYPIQRADAVRYVILYVYGGLYVDLDIVAKKPLDDLFQSPLADVFLLRSPNGNGVTNCLMAGRPKADFWLHTLNIMKEQWGSATPWRIGKHISVMWTTGPKMLETAVDSYRHPERIHYLPSSYLFPSECDVCADKPCSTREAYVRVVEGSSWCGLDSMLLQAVYCNYGKLLVVIALVMFVYVMLPPSQIDH